jgi:agmatine deiminase
VAVATAISRFEPVTMAVSTSQFQNARYALPETVRVVELSANDAWMRDVGPTFVVIDKGEIRGVDWQFNAWGGTEDGLYFPWDLDELVARKVMEMTRVDGYEAPLILEGGSIHVDGQGTLITTEECLLNPNRNPHLNRDEIENHLRDYLNIQKVGVVGISYHPFGREGLET